MVVLTAKEKSELNTAILEYLIKNGFQATAKQFQDETDVEAPDGKATSVVRTDVLERKWKGLAKLKMENIGLEKQIKQLKEQAEAGINDLSVFAQKKGFGDGLPREPEKYKLDGHRGKVTKVISHPLYSICASASEDASIRLWDYEQGEHEQTLKSHTGVVNYLAFNNNGQNLASCSTDLTIKLWNMETFKVIKTLNGHEHEVSCIAYLPSGDFLLSCSRDESIKFWDTQTGYCLQTLTAGHSDWIRRLAVHESGKLFASASKDESIVIWNCEMIKQKSTSGSGGLTQEDAIIAILSGHDHVIDCIAWATEESSRTIENANYNGGGHDTGANEQNGHADDAHEEPKGAADALDTDDSRANLQVRLTTKERIQKMKENLKKKRDHKKDAHDGHEEEKKEVVVDTNRSSVVKEGTDRQRPAQHYLASGSRDKTIKIWEVKNSRCVITLVGHDNWVTDLCFHPSGRYLLSVSDDKSLRVWDLSTGRCTKKLLSIHQHFVTSVAIKQKTVVTASVDQSLKVWQCR